MGDAARDGGKAERFCASPATWEIFLGHIATMSPLAASRLPGMPSPKAFEHKRRRDPAFGQRAQAVMGGRRVRRTGRHRSTPEQWALFLEAVRSSGLTTVCRLEGMPSEMAVYKRRARDAVFAAELTARLASRTIPRVGHRPAAHRGRCSARVEQSAQLLDVTFREQLSQNALYAAVMAALPVHLPPIAREDVASDMMLAVLDGQLELGDLQSRAKEFVRRHWKMFGTFRDISLDAPAGPIGNATIGDFISAAPVDALEEMPDDDDAPGDERSSEPPRGARWGARAEGRGQSYNGSEHP